ncbi:DUF1631 family protein [Diaphorobacter ruginosibacter]|uniref:DUF1631 family protein n=1 Tax=Diaphorobacter ruginosibacter TaxID=1715720 RepID=A0A7G9RK41_9BURK|nr:DUF1631 family protein [Diaphorobacter ruginosibacter]QNN55966.1 DUF1631 family protein [Diaphorobacter ruginosibacter]
MPLPAPQLTAVFRACIVNAVKDGEALMGQLIRSTRSELAEAEQRAGGIHERMHLNDALRALDQHEPALVKNYPIALLEIFGEGASSEPQSRSRAAIDTGLDFGELSLVDDNAVMAQVELARAQQIASHATDAALSELNTYVSSAQGLSNVQPERNPLRPENYIRGLQRVVDESGVGPEIRQLWMGHMRELLGAELITTYQQITKSLKEHGIRPVGYHVAAIPGASRGLRHGAAGTDHGHGHTEFAASPLPGSGAQPFRHVPGAAAAADPQEAMLTVGILRQMLAAGGDPYAFDMASMGLGAAMNPRSSLPPMMPMGASSMQGGMPAFTSTQTAEAMEDFAQLERLVGRLAGNVAPTGMAGMPGMPHGVPVHHHGHGAMASMPTQWQGMSVPAQLSNFGDMSSRSATEVLSRMMEHISQDSRLLAPVQRAVQNLEPALKQLVRNDPSFFSNEQHPARRLLDGLTQRSLSFKAEDSRGFRKYIQLVNAAVQHLSTVPVHDAKAFEHVSDALESAWNTQVHQLRKHQDAEQNALEQAERRELLAARIAQQFRVLPEASGAPQDILDFVTGAWARIAAQAQILAEENGAVDAPDPNTYLAVVPQLLWCSLPEHSPADAKRMLPLMEGLFATIRDGLRNAGHADDEIVRVLKRIAGLQVQLAKCAAMAEPKPEVQAEEVSHEPEDRMPSADSVTVHAALDLDLSDLDDAPLVSMPAVLPMVVQDAPVVRAVPQVAAEAETPALPAAVESAAAPIESVGAPATATSALHVANLFELGQWIELTTNNRTVRTQLTWVSPHNTLFLFTAIDASTQSMTRRMLDKLYAEGHVRRIDDQRVVARALGAVQAERHPRSGFRSSSNGPDSRTH